MVKKKIDTRIRTLIENGVKAHHRTFFVLIGDHGREQVVHLHYMLSKAQVTARPSVLWCYKSELGFSTHRKKRAKEIKKAIKSGVRDADHDDPFELFISATNIRYTYYKESDRILGQTFGMLVLQDFEALTPNLLARTVETVEGGGIVVLLLRTMQSLKQLYTMTMDVHSRYRTEAHHDVVARFNERFLLSLTQCRHCLVLDDQLNVLPISATSHQIEPLDDAKKGESTREIELRELKQSLLDTQPIGSLVQSARTLDQAKALLTFMEAIADKRLRSTVALTAGRGRGKSAALGLAMASAVSYGYANIFVTAPSPENVKTLFEFVLKGFDALKYEEHLDYDVIQSTHEDWNKAIVRINIHRQHRQTIQYIQPEDAHVLGQAELVVIDEAAAIPLPLVRQLMGNYLVFMASTIHGYEGTGRSLSLKLVKQLREQSNAEQQQEKNNASRLLREIQLDEPIRYAMNDPIEQWLHQLLCLDAVQVAPRSQLSAGCPHPSQCELYAVNRDALFSFHPASEQFLQRVMSLYVASHYKNSPNDLQLMSDAPAHRLFVLLPPVDPNQTQQLPEVLCVIQVCLEGELAKSSIQASLARGQRSGGDLIPWTISQQFQDEDFGRLSGARVVRIAVHPDYQKMGYGSRALRLLEDFYQGQCTALDEEPLQDDDLAMPRVMDQDLQDALHQEVIAPRRQLPPLLSKLHEIRAPRVHWMGVSYGMTMSLLRFWKRAGYLPVYLRQTKNELTGEHTCVMLKSCSTQGLQVQCNDAWLTDFNKDFKKRFVQLLSQSFRDFAPITALSLLESSSVEEKSAASVLSVDHLHHLFSVYDLKRLTSYANQLLDYHLIMDLVPAIAMLHFRQSQPVVTLSPVQSSILLGLGLQHKTVEQLEKELHLQVSQILAIFVKVLRKFSDYFRQIEESALVQKETKEQEEQVKQPESNLKRPLNDEMAWDPTEQSLQQDLNEAGNKVNEELRHQQRELIQSLDLSQYAIGGSQADWDAALEKRNDLKSGTAISIPNPESSKKQKLKSQVASQLLAEHQQQKHQKKKLKK